MTSAQPVGDAGRAEVLDVLRGVALLGIFVAHVPGFSGWDYLSAAEHAAVDSRVDVVLHFLRDTFVRGKFYSLFSLLFGVGFALQRESATRRGDAFRRRFRRRQLGLLGIGVAHSAVWHGDILVTYALLGLALLFFADASPRRLLTLGIGALVLRGAWGVLTFAIAGALEGVGRDTIGDATGAVDVSGAVSAVTAGYFSSAWSELLAANLEFLELKWLLLLYDGRFWSIAGCFLLGAAFGGWRVHVRLDELDETLRRVLRITLPIGLVGNLALAVLWDRIEVYPPSALGVLTNTIYCVAIPSLTLALAAGVCLLWQRAGARRWLRIFAPCGRTALTTYLTQTLVGISLFYGVGLGWRGEISLADCMGIAALVFAGQTLIATLWLRTFRYGPIEWTWRCVTYGKRLPLLRA